MCVEESTEKLKEILSKRGYTLQGSLGKGAFATCYRVFHRKKGYHFACKVTLEENIFNTEILKHARESYYEEIQLLRMLNHTNIIRIYDYFEIDSYKVLIMELCQNENLEQKVPPTGFSEIELLNYSGQLIDAVRYLHSRCIIHHDIKPSNCLIDSYGRLKLSDFGLAHQYQSHNSELKRGTLVYAAPEVLGSQKYDPYKADVWSLGATLYKLAYGKLPVDIGDVKEMKRLLPLAASNVNFHNIRPELAGIISRCLRYDPASRPTVFQIAAEFSRIKRPDKKLKLALSMNCMMKQPSTFHQIVAQKRTTTVPCSVLKDRRKSL